MDMYTKAKKGQHMNIVKVIIIIIANGNLDVHNTPYMKKHNREKKKNQNNINRNEKKK